MDDRQHNNVKALAASSVSLASMVILASVLLIPIYEHQRETIIEDNCPNGLENCNIMIEPMWGVWALLGMPSIIVYFVTYRHFENKRVKSWRSYR